jgi:hypothetical protein
VTTLARIVLLAALLAPTVASAQNNVAYKVGPGIQMSCGTTVPTATSTRGILWCKSSDSNKLHYFPPGGSDAAVGGAGGSTWPLTNGTSTLTYSFGGSDGASAVAHRFTAGVGFATDGDLLLRLDANGTNWLTIGRSSSQNAFTFTGNANATGSGPLFVVSPTGSAGVTLDATGGGGRKFTLYSTSTGLLGIADLTASRNDWVWDPNGAYYPFTDGAFNLGLPGARPGGFYTYAADLAGSYTQNIASVTGQQANLSVIASTAATSSGTQSNSPGILLRGAAWNTSALAGQPFDFLMQVIPTAGGANPVTGQLSFYSQANAGGWTERFRITPTRATALQGFVVTQGFGAAYRTSATTVTVAITDHFVGVTGTGARTVNLPAANTCLAAGQEFVIQDVAGDTGTITINRASTDTINGATSITITGTAYARKTLYCNASNAWFASSANN